MDFTGVLFYPDGSTASLDCSFNACSWRQWLEVRSLLLPPRPHLRGDV
jgi:hypothetical protein